MLYKEDFIMEETKMNVLEKLNYVEGFNPQAYLINLAPYGSTEKQWYMPVHARLLWFHLKYPKGIIRKNILHMDDKMVVVEAKLYADSSDLENNYLSTAWAQRYYDPSSNYGMRYLECAETSAEGRALGKAGFGSQYSDVDPDEPGEPIPVDTPLNNDKQIKAHDTQKIEEKPTKTGTNQSERTTPSFLSRIQERADKRNPYQQNGQKTEDNQPKEPNIYLTVQEEAESQKSADKTDNQSKESTLNPTVQEEAESQESADKTDNQSKEPTLNPTKQEEAESQKSTDTTGNQSKESTLNPTVQEEAESLKSADEFDNQSKESILNLISQTESESKNSEDSHSEKKAAINPSTQAKSETQISIPTKDMSEEEINRLMTLDFAKQVVSTVAAGKNRKLGEIMNMQPGIIEWIANKYMGKDKIMKVAAAFLLDHKDSLKTNN